MSDPASDTLRPGEAAAALDISTNTLIRLGDQGLIAWTPAHPWSKERRYTRAEVERVKGLKTVESTDERSTDAT
jgi:DNA-binding transcriptional MerR regulator